MRHNYQSDFFALPRVDDPLFRTISADNMMVSKGFWANHNQEYHRKSILAIIIISHLAVNLDVILQ